MTSHPYLHPSFAYTPAPPISQAKAKRRWFALPLTALAAAIAASTLTVAALEVGPQPAATTVTRVVQGTTSAPDWTQTAAAASPSVVAIQVSGGQVSGGQVSGSQGSAEGSGVILDTTGHVVTNNHVVSALGSGATVQVTLNDHRVYQARIVGTDASTDLAVIQLVNAPQDLQPITIADVSQLKVGQPVMALGNPLGLSETVTTGIVSALDRPVITQQSQSQTPQTRQQTYQAQAQQSVTNAIQTNAAINPGNSGGALVNADGQLIGITSSIATLGASTAGESGNIGIGFAIPANEVQTVTGELIGVGKASHAYLGVATADATASNDGAQVTGAGVKTVASGTPAAQAGLRESDVIIALDDAAVSSSDALLAQIRDHKVGDRVTVTAIRGGQRQEFQVTLADTPQ